MPKKILVIKLGALGDFVLTTGMMRAIREKHPDAHITLMTMKPFVVIGEQSGYFDAVIVDNRSRNLKEWWRVCKKQIADGGFDIIYDCQVSNRTKNRYFKLVRLLARSSFTWGRWVQGGFDLWHIAKTGRWGWGKVTRSFEAITAPEPNLSFMTGPQTYFKILPNRFVLMIPGCSKAHPYKRWPAESFATVVRTLAQQGIASVVLGTGEEADVVNQIVAAHPTAVSFLNKATLLDIPALAGRAALVIGNDTGPMHMAALSGVPSVYLFCDKTRGSANSFSNITNLFGHMIEDITPEQVLDVIQSKIKPL